MNPFGNIFPPGLFNPLNWLIAFVIFILFVLIVREILCWYWKINKIINLLEDIKENTSHKAQPIKPVLEQKDIPKF